MSNIQVMENQFVSVIERVATDPTADIGKLEKMLDMQERVMTKQAEQAFAESMASMQSEMPRVFNLAQGHNITYARLEDINDTIRPVLQKHGFCVTFATEQSDLKSVKITAICSHKMGAKQETALVLPLDTSGSKNAVQAVGSTVSYGKRYTLCALLNISTGDDTNGFGLGKSAGEISGVSAISNEDIAKLHTYLNMKTNIEFRGWVKSLEENLYNDLYNSGPKGNKILIKSAWDEKEKAGVMELNDWKALMTSTDDEILEDAREKFKELSKEARFYITEFNK